jgi:hypothetical protein
MVLGRNYEITGGGPEKAKERKEIEIEKDDEENERVVMAIFDVIALFAGANNMSQSANAERVARNLKVHTKINK